MASSIYFGVTRNLQSRRKPWKAQLNVNKKKLHLGYFAHEIDAGNAVDTKLVEIGEKPVNLFTSSRYGSEEYNQNFFRFLELGALIPRTPPPAPWYSRLSSRVIDFFAWLGGN